MSDAAPGDLIPGARAHAVSVGPLAFTIHEMGEGPLVLLLHGFPDGPGTWCLVMPVLAEAGFRCAAVTLRGYEASSRPADGGYRLADLAGDVSGLIAALGADRAHLVGHDWGATIAFAAAAGRPDQTLSLSMISVPHPLRFALAMKDDKAQVSRSSYIVFFQLKGLSDWWVGRGRAGFVERLWRKWSPNWTPEPTALGDARRRLSDRATRRAALDYYRQALDRSPAAAPSHALLASTVQAPTLGLIGSRDACIGADIYRASMQPEDFPGGLRVETLDAGHFPQLEQPRSVATELLRHLSGSGRGL